MNGHRLLASSHGRLDEDMDDGSLRNRENGFSIFKRGTVLDRSSGYPVCSSMVFRSDWWATVHVIPEKTHRDYFRYQFRTYSFATPMSSKACLSCRCPLREEKSDLPDRCYLLIHKTMLCDVSVSTKTCTLMCYPTQAFVNAIWQGLFIPFSPSAVSTVCPPLNLRGEGQLSAA